MTVTINPPTISAAAVGEPRDSVILQTLTVQGSFPPRWRMVLTGTLLNLGQLEVWNATTMSWSEVWTLAQNEIGQLVSTTSTDAAAKAASWQAVADKLAERATSIVNAGT